MMFLMTQSIFLLFFWQLSRYPSISHVMAINCTQKGNPLCLNHPRATNNVGPTITTTTLRMSTIYSRTTFLHNSPQVKVTLCHCYCPIITDGELFSPNFHRNLISSFDRRTAPPNVVTLFHANYRLVTSQPKTFCRKAKVRTIIQN